MPPIIPRPNNRDNRSEEQKHYDSLTSYLKYALGITGTLIALIVSVAIYFSYSSARDMRQEYKESITDFKSQIAELKSEAKQTALDVKQNSKEAVAATKEFSENEISRIKLSTTELAMSESKKKVEQLFETDKIKDMVQNQAVEKIKSSVEGIVAQQTENFSSISDAAAEMRVGYISGMQRLKEFFLHPKNSIDASTAKKLYDKITYDYYSKYDTSYHPTEGIPQEALDSIKNGYLPKSYIGDNLKTLVENLISIDDQYGGNEVNKLDAIVSSLMEVSAYAGVRFNNFDRDAANKWFKSLKK